MGGKRVASNELETKGRRYGGAENGRAGGGVRRKKSEARGAGGEEILGDDDIGRRRGTLGGRRDGPERRAQGRARRQGATL